MAAVDVSGNMHLCCIWYVPQTVGNIENNSFEAVWNSPMAQKIRQSILDGTYEYCSSACPHLYGDQKGWIQDKSEVTDTYLLEIIRNGITKLPRGPQVILPAYDTTCNLSCPSCRSEVIVLKKEEFNRVTKLHEKVLAEAVKNARLVVFSGQGDAFSSRIYRGFLQNFKPEDYPDLTIFLVTNGQLLTPGMWHSIRRAHSRIGALQISFNAGTPETYAKMQRGGTLERLLENLAFVKQLRQRGDLPALLFSFYVCNPNWREIKLFINIAKEYGADLARFTVIDKMDGGAFTAAGYEEIEIFDPRHPEHQDFRNYLNDPIFLDPIVEIGSLYRHFPEGFFKEKEDRQSFNFRDVDRRRLATIDTFCDWLEASRDTRPRIEEHLRALKVQYIEIMSLPPANHDLPSPLHLSAELYAESTDTGHPYDEAQLATHIAAQRPKDHPQSYKELYAERAAPLVESLRALLAPEQRVKISPNILAALVTVPISEDPLSAEIVRRVAQIQAADRIDIPTISASDDIQTFPGRVRALSLTQAQEMILRQAIAQAKHAFVHFNFLPPVTGEAPGTTLARLLTTESPNAWQQFEHAMSTIQIKLDDLQATVRDCVALVEAAATKSLETALSPAQRALITNQFPGPLHDWPAENDPFSERLEQEIRTIEAENTSTV